MCKRTDIHRPSAFNHDDYEFIGCGSWAIGDCPLAQICIKEANEEIAEYQRRTGAEFSTHRHGGNCHVCGATFLDFAVFLHVPTGQLIRVGADCAKSIADGHAIAQFAAYRDKAAAARRRARGITIGRERLEERCPAAAAILDARDQYEEANPRDRETGATPDGRRWVPETYEEATIADIVGRLYQRGSISDKQWSFLDTLVEKHQQRKIREAERQAERDARPAVPESILDGRHEISGEVAALKTVENDYGVSTRMLVKTDSGWVAWGTVPSSIEGVDRGQRVMFTARFNRGDENGFAFFSRPTRACIAN